MRIAVAAIDLVKLLREVLRIADDEQRSDGMRRVCAPAVSALPSSGTTTWKPFEPEVLTQLGSPSSSSRSRSCSAAVQLVACVDRRIEIEHADVGMVEIRRARGPHVRRDAVLIGQPQQRPRVCDERMVHDAVLLRHLDPLQPGRESFETSFWMNPLRPMPAGKRSIVTGRPRRCGTITGAIAS